MKTLEPLTKRSVQLLRKLYEKGQSTSTYTLRVKQDELSDQLGISRQALNVHLRKLKNRGYIRTGRGFIDVTDKGLNALGVSTTPAFILIKVSPIKRIQVYDKIKEIAVNDRGIKFGNKTQFRILLKDDCIESYCNNYLMTINRIPKWNGKIGVTSTNTTLNIEKIYQTQ